MERSWDTYIHTRIEALDRSGQIYETKFLIDTGATDCLAPGSALKAAGIKEERREIYELADGQAVELPWGWARITFMGQETINKIIFAAENSEPLLGVMALEGAGVVIDAITNTLRRVKARSLKAANA